MTIPDNVSHMEFWKLAKAKGIKINSKYVGVHLNINTNGSPSWMAKVQDARGKLFAFKRFPLTEKGKKDAGKFYNMKKTEMLENQKYKL